MALLRLSICISGVYAAFLLWAVAQERLSAPFPSTDASRPSTASRDGDKFPSPLFLNYAQALASFLSALSYLLFTAWRNGSLGRTPLLEVLGLDQILPHSLRLRLRSASPKLNGYGGSRTGSDGLSNGAPASSEPAVDQKDGPQTPWRKSLPALLTQVSVFQTTAGPIGFMALRHISYPTMVLGKSCKLIPVMLLNVLLYRRRFSAHKYIVVAFVTVGISMFMLLGAGGKKKKGGSDSLWGLTLLGFNLFVDGLTNSTQDQIFSTYPGLTGQQMMLSMALITQLILLPCLLLPLPSHLSSLLHYLPGPMYPSLLSTSAAPTLAFSQPAGLESVAFLLTHPTALVPLLAYALLGGLGQLFIFETIQHFGSLTLVMVTVTRKLFTMLLSVAVFGHKLSPGQWMGVGVVFAGIGLEAAMKRNDVMRKARRTERRASEPKTGTISGEKQ